MLARSTGKTFDDWPVRPLSRLPFRHPATRPTAKNPRTSSPPLFLHAPSYSRCISPSIPLSTLSTTRIRENTHDNLSCLSPFLSAPSILSSVCVLLRCSCSVIRVLNPFLPSLSFVLSALAHPPPSLRSTSPHHSPELLRLTRSHSTPGPSVRTVETSRGERGDWTHPGDCGTSPSPAQHPLLTLQRAAEPNVASHPRPPQLYLVPPTVRPGTTNATPSPFLYLSPPHLSPLPASPYTAVNRVYPLAVAQPFNQTD